MVRVYKENDKYFMEDNGDTQEVTKISYEKKTGKYWLILPTNSSNRKGVDISKITDDGINIEYRETRVLGARLSTGDKKPWLEYLTEEELEQYNSLVEIAKQRKSDAEKKQPLTAIEKARIKLAKAQAEVDRLLGSDE